MSSANKLPTEQRDMVSPIRVVAEKDIAHAMFQFDARHLTLIDRRDLWHLVKQCYKYQEITASKVSELIGVPLSELRFLLTEWEQKEEDKDV